VWVLSAGVQRRSGCASRPRHFHRRSVGLALAGPSGRSRAAMHRACPAIVAGMGSVTCFWPARRGATPRFCPRGYDDCARGPSGSQAGCFFSKNVLRSHVHSSLLRWRGPLCVTRYASRNALARELGLSRSLSPLRWNVLNSGCELCMCCGIDGPVSNPRAGGVCAQKVVALPVLRWSDWPGHERAAAVWADVLQEAFDAPCTKRAFIGAHARFQ
jgi:hypothetical protein